MLENAKNLLNRKVKDLLEQLCLIAIKTSHSESSSLENIRKTIKSELIREILDDLEGKELVESYANNVYGLTEKGEDAVIKLLEKAIELK